MRALIIEAAELAGRIQQALLPADIISTLLDPDDDPVEVARVDPYDVIILGAAIPAPSPYGGQGGEILGLPVLRQLRAAGIKAPVLMMSALPAGPDMDNRVEAFAAGCDDYMTKPFNRREFVARVNALLRRSNGHVAAAFTHGELSVDFEARTVTVAGEPIHLTGREYALFKLLCLRRHQVVTKEQVLANLYACPDDEPEIKIVDVYVCKLRRKLGRGDLSAGFRFIGTSWGRGYFLVRDPATAAIPTPRQPGGRPPAAPVLAAAA